MKKFLALFGLVLIHGFGSCSSMAQSLSVSPYDVYGIQSPLNYVKNPFAKDNGMYVTSSNASCGRDGSTNKLFGYASHTVDTSALNGYCEYELKPIVEPHTNGNCEFKGVVFGDGSLYRAQVLNSTPTLVAETPVLVNSTGGWAEFSVNAPCSSAPKVRITQTEAGTSPQIKVGLYYGRATNIGKGTAPNEFSANISSAGVITGQGPRPWLNSCAWSPAGHLTCNETTGANVTMTCVGTLQGTDSADQAPNRAVHDVNAKTILMRAQTGAGTGTNIAYSVICKKNSPDAQLDTITAPNWNFAPRTYTSSVSGLGTGSATVDRATISRSGANATVCIRIVKDGTNGTGSSTVTFSLPPGIGVNSSFGSSLFVGTGWTSNNALGTVSLSARPSNGDLAWIIAGNPTLMQGSQILAANTFQGCVTFPATENGIPWTETYNAQQLNGSVNFGTDVKAEKNIGVTTVDYGVSSVTATAGTNVSAVQSPVSCRYTRVGNVVTSNCMIQITCTTAAYSAFTITTPVAGTPSAMSGTMGSSTDEVGRITTSGSNALVEFVCKNTSAVSRAINFTYVLP